MRHLINLRRDLIARPIDHPAVLMEAAFSARRFHLAESLTAIVHERILRAAIDSAELRIVDGR
jgi:hypothetical protein